MMASSGQRLNCKRARSCLHTWMTCMSSPARGGPGRALTSSLRASKSIAESRPMSARRACTMLATGRHRLECTSSGTKSGAATDRPASAGSPRWACPSVTRTTSANGGADAYGMNRHSWTTCRTFRTCSARGSCCSYAAARGPTTLCATSRQTWCSLMPRRATAQSAQPLWACLGEEADSSDPLACKRSTGWYNDNQQTKCANAPFHSECCNS